MRGDNKPRPGAEGVLQFPQHPSRVSGRTAASAAIWIRGVAPQGPRAPGPRSGIVCSSVLAGRGAVARDYAGWAAVVVCALRMRAW